MKSKVLDRPMFKKKGPPIPLEEADNVGIMQGFMDQVDGMDDMDDEGDDDEMEMGKMMDRRPDSPEILMNNLRGDMRSVDARVEELADLVGYRAASETPTEVLALLQPVLAQQATMAQPPPEMMGAAPAGPMAEPAGGVADLAAMAQGPQTAPPMPMPEAPPPGGIGSLPAAAEQQAPIAMARGGIVQHFQQGSDEEGVTLVDAGAQASYPPELVARAQQDLANLMSERPQRSPSLEQAMSSRLPMYQNLLGMDKEAVQAQMLFDIASGALNVAAGVDAEGRPIRGGVSPVGRFAAGMKNVPAMIGARAGELSKAQREAKLLALQAGEKDIAVIREYNYKLLDSQRKASADIVKAAARSQGFGTGVKGSAWNFVTKFAPEYGAGTLPPDMDRRFESSYAIISEPTFYTDPYTGNVVRRDPPIPDFVRNSLTLRKNIPTPGKKGPPPTDGAMGIREIPSTTGAVTTDQEPAVAPVSPPSRAKKEPTLWELTPVLTGPIPTAKDVISSIPGFGDVGKDVTQARARYLGDFRELVKSLQNSPVYAQSERRAIEDELNVEPRFFDDPAKLRNKLIGIDNFLFGRIRDAERNSTNANLPVDQRKEHARVKTLIENFRPKLGIPVRIYTIKEVEKLAPGTPFLWNGSDLRVRQ